MTRAAEKARAIAEEFQQIYYADGKVLKLFWLQEHISAALTEAVEAEREACAQVAERELERLEAVKEHSYVNKGNRSLMAEEAELIMMKIRQRSRGEG